MALNKDTLKIGIAALLTDMMTRQNVSIDEFSTRLSDMVDTYVKGADIVYTSGLTAPNGAVTGTFEGNLI